MIENIRVRLSGGIRFDNRALQCTVYDNNYAFGGLFISVGVFAAYILFFRPDIYKEVSAIIWIFRVIFPFGFGLAGLLMLGCGVRTVFDVKLGTFVYTKISLFTWITRKGLLREVTQIVLDASFEGPEERPGDESGRYYMFWRLKLSMEIGGELVSLREWKRKAEGNRPQNEALDEAKKEAERLAFLICCPFALANLKEHP